MEYYTRLSKVYTWQDVITNSPITLDTENDTIERDENGYPLGWVEDTAEGGSGIWDLIN